MTAIKKQFLLNPDVIFLNHGSFGACPRPVFEAYQHWQRELERQPVEFLGRRATSLMAEARENLAAYLNCQADEVVYFPNPTTAINMVARNLDLQPGDEILTTDHEYGAMDRTWRYICGKTGARYVHQPIRLPVTTSDAFVETFWSGVTPKTRLLFISHITSPTALIFPVEEICRRAREAGLLCIVDGAHAPGQIPLDLTELGADLYTGACHKWLLAPKGSAFLYTRREMQDWLDPLVISWGYDAAPDFRSGSIFVDYHEWQGTRDISAFLSVPAAIEFHAQNQWDTVRERCHQLAIITRQRINALTGLPSICPDSWLGQMFAARLPDVDVAQVKTRLYEESGIEVPIHRWNDQPLIRVSINGYNTQSDLDALVDALAELLPHP
ncbi:MAG: aminotransferase class V-fold PLP-dependent enzyme [Chloroflexi bacterium]|nr:aminotransferase class V-fold PLP-dependent enzyme [Chloroflexota bacterium]MBU1660324.1 aminotransferase class V-fold PLP-dependent enzyme [Chloroflexota bacterium]